MPRKKNKRVSANTINKLANQKRIESIKKFKTRSVFNNTMEYISAGTGTGKTAYIIDTVKSNPTEQYLIVTPSKELCSEIASRMNKEGIPSNEYTVVHQDMVSNPVDTVAVSLVDAPSRIIITTQMALLHGFLQDIIRYKFEWNLIMDEDFKPLFEQELKFTKTTVELFDTAFSAVRSELNDDLLDIIPNQKRAFNRNLMDSFLQSPSVDKFNNFVRSSGFFVTMTKGQYETFTNYKEKVINSSDYDDKGYKLHVTSFIKPELLLQFKSVLISSSKFELSLSYKIFTMMGIILKQKSIDPKYSAMPDRDYSNVTIKYFSDKNWSKSVKAQQFKNKTFEQMIYERASNEFQGQPFIYNANRSFRDKCTNGTLVTSIHGVNSHIGIKNVLYMPALNASADVVRVLSTMGITRKDIDFDRNVLSAYQFASRSAIRDPNNTEDITIYVTDKRTADFLSEEFSNSKVEYICLMKTKKKISDADKSFVCRIRKRINDGEKVREATMAKFDKIISEYYNGETGIK